MRKIFFLSVLLAGLPLAARTGLELEKTEKNKGLVSGLSFTPLQLGIGYFDYGQLFDCKADTVLAFAIFGLSQHSSVLSAAPLNQIRYNYFLQSGIVGVTEENMGIAVLLFNGCNQNFIWQTGLLNFSGKNSGLQIAACNIDLSRLSSPLEQSGLQIGLFNLGSKIQIGLFNIGKCKFQFGLYNQDGEFQIGLFNKTRNGWLPWMVFFNFSRRPDKTKTGNTHAGEV